MSKRPIENVQTDSNESKKMNFNAWKKPEMPDTPPSTPNSTSKYNFNIWNKSGDNVNFDPIKISELNVVICLNRPFRFRVSFKSEKKSSKNGDMFKFHAIDGNDEISITVFPQQLKFFDDIMFNQTYELVNFNVKCESKDFPVFVGNGKYLSLLSSSKITIIENAFVPEFKFNFVDVGEVHNLELNSRCDVLAIITNNWGVETFGENKMKRDLSITDKSKGNAIVTLWGSSYEKFEHVNSTILIHNGIVKEYNGAKTISCSTYTLFWSNPELKIAEELKSWFDAEIVLVNKN